MFYQKASQWVNQLGSEGFILSTQILTHLGWFKSPKKNNTTLGAAPYIYSVNRNWSKASKKLFSVNNCHEMVINKKKEIYLLTDHPNNNILIYANDGTLVNSWSLGLRGAHGLTLAEEHGVEFLWICDPYSAKVIKTDLNGNIKQTLPTPHQLGIYKKTQPYLPTQTAVAPNGDIYVADGYGSQHIIQFDCNGSYIRHFGGKNKGSNFLDFAHGLEIDNRDPLAQTLLVTSRKASCIKRFSLDGQYLSQIELPGGYPCRPRVHGEHLYISLCWSGSHLNPNSGFVVILDKKDRVCATLGGTAEFDSQHNLKQLSSDYSCFYHVHDVCVHDEGNIYVCQWNAGKRHPIKLVRQHQDS